MDGIISLIKPPGITSHDAVGIVRRILKERKVGHSGTLDPMATGVLPIFIGKATRLIEYSQHMKKSYIGEGQFGVTSDTEDITGALTYIEKNLDNRPKYEECKSLLEKFTGRIYQRPSSFSAIKIDGKRAYELARKGEEVIIPKRKVTIHKLEILAYEYPYFTLSIQCSSGTYIRALIRDLGKELNNGAIMTSLLRTKVGPFDIANSFTVEELENLKDDAILPMDMAVSHLPSLRCSFNEARDLCQGKRLSHQTKPSLSFGIYRMYYESRFIGIVEIDHRGIHAKKIIVI